MIVTLERVPAYVATLWATDDLGNRLHKTHSAVGLQPDKALHRLAIPPGVTVVDFSVNEQPPSDGDKLIAAIKLAIAHMEADREKTASE